MKLIPQQKLNKALDKALLKHRPFISEIELFKTELIKVLDHTDQSESEEFHKNLVSNFLTNAFYANTHFINTKGRQDLVIHTGKDNKHSVGVIIEAKRPTNKADWFTADKPNSKALQELVLYYLRERIEAKNIDIKYLIATNINEWYIIESSHFKKLFYDNKKLVKDYEEWRDGNKDGKDTALFYNDIAKAEIDKITDEIPCIYFNIRDYEKALRSKQSESNRDINALFKILSPYHLLKVPFANDSNELDDKFYKELLHIIGLEEAKDGNKNIIGRKIANRNNASLLEKAIEELKTEGLHKVPDLKSFGNTSEQQFFNIALELCITWINRILFLKLLEGQLINYHKGDQQYRFLNNGMVPNFSELFILFHKVLAVNIPDRSQAIQQKYNLIPYLNSSLFEISDLEDVTINIKAIDSSETLEYVGSTILKDHKKKNDKLKTIDYLFRFLDAYDFASEDTGDTREDNKTLINAAVLGKVFEKINGYKDGSIYTPGFITMYMSRQSIRLAILQKFNEANGWDCKEFKDLKEYIEYQQPEARNQANTVINNLKICDPAVGSGHFLVSALNEIITIKSELNILQDVNGKRLKEYSIDVIHDELLITDEDNEIFIYNPNSPQSLLIQQTLFTEKQTIIENCLFGVDINPNSVKICGLRLWIELLKNAYYKDDGNLETLPNIDINIKCGNSLLSRTLLDADLSQVFKQKEYSYKKYKEAVNSYKNTSSKKDKELLKQFIKEIKEKLKEAFSINDKLLKDLSSKRGQLYLLDSNIDLFGNKLLDPEAVELEKRRINLSIAQIEQQIQDKKNNALYKNAFEWRFEFPEVLNNNGDFEGFDLIIGNPPYMTGSSVKLFHKYFKNTFKTAQYQLDLYVLFIEKTQSLLINNGFVSFITPNSWLKNLMMSDCRKFVLDNFKIISINPNISNAFDVASVDTMIYIAKKSTLHFDNRIKIWSFNSQTPENKIQIEQSRFYENDKYVFDVEVDEGTNLILKKIRKNTSLMSELHDIIRGINPYDALRGQSQETIQGKAYHSAFKKDETFVPEIRGKHVQRYMYKWDEKHYISYGKWLAAPREAKFFKGDRLVFREILGATNFVCTVISEEMKIDRSLYIALPKEHLSVSIKFIQSILGSRLLAWAFRLEKNEFDALFPKIRLEEFKNLPIKMTDNQKPFIDLVDQLLESKRKGEDTTDLEQQIDALVYELYDLTPDEIAIVENSGNTKNKEPESQLLDIENV